MLEDGVKGHVYCIVYRPVGSLGKLQGVQERVSDGFEVEQHKTIDMDIRTIKTTKTTNHK